MAVADGSGKPADVVYGVQAVREALRAAARPFVKILLGRRDSQTTEIFQLAKASGIPVHLEPRQALDRLVPHGKHQGVVALVAAKAYQSAEAILAQVDRYQDRALVLVLDGLQDPQNFGAVLRTAEGAGVHGVFIPERRAVGLTPTVAKASAGAVEYVPVATVVNIGRLLEDLQHHHVWVYAVEEAAPKSYLDVDLTGPIALVFGGEGGGIRRGVVEKCDERMRIPMAGQLSSLNVSAAVAVVLFEVVRQRRAKVNESESSHLG